MVQAKSVYIKRALADRRSPVSRRVENVVSGKERRGSGEDRRIESVAFDGKVKRFGDRRLNDKGPPVWEEKREHKKDRRKGWEDRYGWERISKWSSSPIFPDLP